MRILVQFRTGEVEELGAIRGRFEQGFAAAEIPFGFDHGYEPVSIPAPVTPGGGLRFGIEQPGYSFEPGDVTYVTRGTIPDEDAESIVLQLAQRENVVGVYSDPLIEPALTCGTSPAVGDVAQVARLLSVPALHDQGLDGTDVYVAVVDTGINKAFLVSRGQPAKLDPQRSWTPAGVSAQAGMHTVGHGTTSAFEVGVVAPEATLLDLAVLAHQATLDVSLSDALTAYDQLEKLLKNEPSCSLVVTNSWAVNDPKTDFPANSASNYTDNPEHAFNLKVGALESLGADILFVAGNCGKQCPSTRCQFDSKPITGANSHAAVLTIGGIDTNNNRVGYSSQGPGRLSARKPDVCTYTHFEGSHVTPVDKGTSVACPLAAGGIAAIRTRFPRSQVSPQRLRTLVVETAAQLGAPGFDNDYGWGALDPVALLAALPLEA